MPGLDLRGHVELAARITSDAPPAGLPSRSRSNYAPACCAPSTRDRRETRPRRGGCRVNRRCAVSAYSRWRRGPARHRGRAPMPAELRQLALCRSPAIGGDRLDQWPVDLEIDIFERRRLVEDLVGRKSCLAHGRSWNCGSLPRCDREIGLPACSRQRSATTPSNSLQILAVPSPEPASPPAALGCGDEFHRRVRFDVGTISRCPCRRCRPVREGSHWRCNRHSPGGIEHGRIVGFQIDQRRSSAAPVEWPRRSAI